MTRSCASPACQRAPLDGWNHCAECRAALVAQAFPGAEARHEELLWNPVDRRPADDNESDPTPRGPDDAARPPTFARPAFPEIGQPAPAGS